MRGGVDARAKLPRRGQERGRDETRQDKQGNAIHVTRVPSPLAHSERQLPRLGPHRLQPPLGPARLFDADGVRRFLRAAPRKPTDERESGDARALGHGWLVKQLRDLGDKSGALTCIRDSRSVRFAAMCSTRPDEGHGHAALTLRGLFGRGPTRDDFLRSVRVVGP